MSQSTPIPMAAPTATATIMIASSVMVPTSLRAGDGVSLLQDTATTPGANTQGAGERMRWWESRRKVAYERALTDRTKTNGKTRDVSGGGFSSWRKALNSNFPSSHHNRTRHSPRRKDPDRAHPRSLRRALISQARTISASSRIRLRRSRCEISSSLRNFNLFYHSHKPCPRRAFYQRDSPHPRSPIV